MEVNINLCLKFDEDFELTPAVAAAIVNRLAEKLSREECAYRDCCTSYLVPEELPFVKEMEVECDVAMAIVNGDKMADIDPADLEPSNEEEGDIQDIPFVAFNRRRCIWWTGLCSEWYFNHTKGMWDSQIFRIRRDRSVEDIRDSLLRVMEKRYGVDTMFVTQMEWS